MSIKRKQNHAKIAHKPNTHNGWVPKVTRSEILICTGCKMRYIKTRPKQLVCIKCLRVPQPVTVFHLKRD